LACGDDQVVHVLSAGGTALLTLREGGRLQDRRDGVPGGLRLLRFGRHLLATSLFERSLRVLELSTRGVPERELGRVTHDGPIWAAAAIEHDGQLLVALSGVEDKPLVRAHGEFENIDSFVWLYRISSDGASRVASINVGEHGLIVPKAVSLARTGSELELSALAAGSGKLLRARFPADWSAEPRITTLSVPPGASDAVVESVRISYPSPLLDAWVQVGRGGVQLARIDPETRPPLEVRLGEALFTTELMAPSNTSDRSHSRFTCETCHFEGGVDGRTHHTGRGEVSVVTKALFGLASNRPHFSRARDPDLSSVSHNEFRVAGAGSGQDPWFSVETSDYPWLSELGISRARLSPLELRRALLAFLYAFNHAPNVNVAARSRFDELETAGAKVFSSRCASCHAPRLLTDEASSEVAFEAWDSSIFARNAPLTWARGEYARTGVEPYVDEHGTRITSLRRLGLKPRYFTNGSAADLDEVLERFRDTPSGGLHEAPAGTKGALDSRERRALVAFLRLL
jgi:hypothetical protein